jgi:hypothetical protein
LKRDLFIVLLKTKINKTINKVSAMTASTTIMRIFLIGLFSLFGINVQAQDDSQDQGPAWFEIEIIVFKPTNKLNLNDESWDTDAPFSLANTTDSNQSSDSSRNQSSNQSSNQTWSQLGLIDFVQPLAEISKTCEFPCEQQLVSTDSAQSLQSTQPTQTTQAFSSQSVNRGDPSVIDIESLDEEAALLSKLNQLVDEQPFTPLQSELFQLSQESANLARHPDYKVLTHLMWRQPVLSKSQAPSIRIAGGYDFSQEFDYEGNKLSLEPDLPVDEAFSSPFSTEPTNGSVNFASSTTSSGQGLPQSAQQSARQLAQKSGQQLNNQELDDLSQEALEHQTVKPVVWVPELDGDIKIYLNRFLHIKTNLVLRRADKELIEAIDLEIYNPEQLSTFNQTGINSDGFNQHANSQQNSVPKAQTFVIDNPFGSKAENGTNNIKQSSNDTSNSSDSIETNAYFSQDSSSESSQFSWEIDDNFLNTESEQLFIERLFNYPVKQSRKVKSNQLHYFDHPLMGILIMIRPYERPTELSQQTAEQVNQ